MSYHYHWNIFARALLASRDWICPHSSKLKVFLKLRSRKTFYFVEQIMSEDKHSSIFRAKYIYIYIQIYIQRACVESQLIINWVTRHTFFAVRSVDQIKEFVSYATRWPVVVFGVVVIGVTWQTEIRKNVTRSGTKPSLDVIREQ